MGWPDPGNSKLRHSFVLASLIDRTRPHFVLWPLKLTHIQIRFLGIWPNRCIHLVNIFRNHSFFCSFPFWFRYDFPIRSIQLDDGIRSFGLTLLIFTSVIHAITVRIYYKIIEPLPLTCSSVGLEHFMSWH